MTDKQVWSNGEKAGAAVVVAAAAAWLNSIIQGQMDKDNREANK
jgi:hypothetical protein